MPYIARILDDEKQLLHRPPYEYIDYTAGAFLLMNEQEWDALPLSWREKPLFIDEMRRLKHHIQSSSFQAHFSAYVANLVDNMNKKGTEIMLKDRTIQRTQILGKILSLPSSKTSLPASFQNDIQHMNTLADAGIQAMEGAELEYSLHHFITLLKVHPDFDRVSSLANNKILFENIDKISNKKKPSSVDCYVLMDLINQLHIPGLSHIQLSSNAPPFQQRLEKIAFPEKLLPEHWRKSIYEDKETALSIDDRDAIDRSIRKMEALYRAFKDKNYLDQYHQFNDLLYENQFSVEQFYEDVKYRLKQSKAGLYAKKEKLKPGRLLTTSPPPLHRCLSLMKTHLETHKEVSTEDLAQLNTSFGFTPLHYAVWSNNIEQVKDILARDAAFLDKEDQEKCTPLIRAIHTNFDIANLLLAHGAKKPALETVHDPIMKALLQGKRYDFNPHRHVKIWLSKHPDVFLNEENQLRLVRMREDCPNDPIHLIYDSRLLTAAGQEQRRIFCEKHQIIPIDMDQDIIQKTTFDPEETKLLAIYHDEIEHLDEEGNLAAASDVLRWLSPVYRLGTYSDFDVSIKTKTLPPLVPVATDILFSGYAKPALVPVTNDIYFTQLFKKMVAESRMDCVFNNDMIAVVDPDSQNIKKNSKSYYSSLYFKHRFTTPKETTSQRGSYKHRKYNPKHRSWSGLFRVSTHRSASIFQHVSRIATNVLFIPNGHQCANQRGSIMDACRRCRCTSTRKENEYAGQKNSTSHARQT